MKNTNADANGQHKSRFAERTLEERLAPHHLAELQASGLRRSAIDLLGITTETNQTLIACTLNHKQQDRNRSGELRGERYIPADAHDFGACISYHYDDQFGQPTDYIAFKPDKPRTIGGKKVKYEVPRGKRPRPYFPRLPGHAERLRDPSVPLDIAEGQKNAAAVAQLGCAVVGINGAIPESCG